MANARIAISVSWMDSYFFICSVTMFLLLATLGVIMNEPQCCPVASDIICVGRRLVAETTIYRISLSSGNEDHQAKLNNGNVLARPEEKPI